MAPTILFIPGLWEGPTPFEGVARLLQARGFPTEIVALPSTGTVSPDNPSMLDDIAAIRTFTEKLVDAGKEVIMVMHSAGGFLGPNATADFEARTRSVKGLHGGVKKMVFLTAAIAEEGYKHGPRPFFVCDGGSMTCLNPEKLLFNDLEEVDAKRWMAALQTQPADGWSDTTTYCGWRDIRSVYLVCEGDLLLPVDWQIQFANLAGSKVEKCGAGHMVMLSMPEKVVELIVNAAGD